MRGIFFCKNKSKKMQNCEKTETNLQVMTKGNQIKNFSKRDSKHPIDESLNRNANEISQ